jgi:AbiV family abortive infection protein
LPEAVSVAFKEEELGFLQCEACGETEARFEFHIPLERHWGLDVKKKLLPSYQGQLTPKQVAEGITAARGNAKRLYEDAELLFERERYPSACALAVLSIEESGKAGILRRIATEINSAGCEKLWREYRTRTKKNVAWIGPEMMRRGLRTLNVLRLIADPTSGHPQVLDALKQLSVYTDCFSDAKWSKPTEAIDKRVAQEIMSSARTVGWFTGFRLFRHVSIVHGVSPR